MKIYQELEVLGQDELKRGSFCADAVNEFKLTSDYKNSLDGEAYYAKHNITIESFQKFLYTFSGVKKPDIISANYKLKTLFFRRLVIQQVQYVLGNGLKLDHAKNKAKLGKDFDFKLQFAAKRAMASGMAFGFWNFDHLEVFGYADTKKYAGFCPLYDENTGKLKAGIRFWHRKIGNQIHNWYTLYEADGITEYHSIENGKVEVTQPKKGYIRTKTTSNAVGVEDISEENYGDLPIVPLYANDTQESELIGIRESVDAYDLIKSGLANKISDSPDIYWIFKNSGAMDDKDMARALERLRTMNATVTEGETELDAQTVNVPYEAREKMLNILRSDIYEDFQALDVKSLSAAPKTTQEIQAAYQSQDNKCADFEYYILEFVQKILELAGIDDNPSFTWNRVVNQKEQTEMILSAANYLSDDMVIKLLPFLTPEQADEVIKQRDAEGFKMFSNAIKSKSNSEDDLDYEPEGDEE